MKAEGLFMYVQPFCYHQAFKGLNAYAALARCQKSKIKQRTEKFTANRLAKY